MFASFKYAFRGIRTAWEGPAFRIMVFAATAVVALIAYLEVSRREAVVLLFAVGFVLTLEVLNTIIEHLLDMFKPRLHHYVRVIKDMMAGAVLIASITALVIGILIFYPYIVPFLS